MTRPTRIVIDTDAGIDDAVALALAARSPEVSIVAVTTTYGNAHLAETTRNAAAVLQHAGRPDIPVYPGADRPLVRRCITSPDTHGTSGLGFARVPAVLPARAVPDPRVLTRVLRDVRGPITLVTLGPLTNLARAIATDRTMIRQTVARHVGMFGTRTERGAPDRWADFNAWCDPEAVEQVLRADLPSTMVSLDVGRRILLTAAEVTFLTNAADPLVYWLASALRFSVSSHRRRWGLNGVVLSDPLTIGHLAAPGVLATTSANVRVDLDEGPHRGHTREGGGSHVQMATAVNVDRMRALLLRVFGRPWLERPGET